MAKTKIKICDVRSFESLEICKNNNVDYIGMHIIDPPISEERIKLYSEIARQASPIKTVLLTKTVPLDTVIDIAKRTNVDYIQIHRSCSVNEVIYLKNEVRKETGKDVGVITLFVAKNCDFSKVIEMSHYADFILFDSDELGGTGLRISISDLKAIADNCKGIPYFIAGGLDPENVSSVISIAHPYGVDVQTNLESAKHIKDPQKVEAFVHNARLADI